MDGKSCSSKENSSYPQEQWWYEINAGRNAPPDIIRQGFGIAEAEWRYMMMDRDLITRSAGIKGHVDYDNVMTTDTIKQAHVRIFCATYAPHFDNAPPRWKEEAVLRLLSICRTASSKRISREHATAVADASPSVRNKPKTLAQPIPPASLTRSSLTPASQPAQVLTIKDLTLNVTLISALDTPKLDETLSIIHLRDIISLSDYPSLATLFSRLVSSLEKIKELRMRERRDVEMFFHPYDQGGRPVKDDTALHEALTNMAKNGHRTGALLRLHRLSEKQIGPKEKIPIDQTKNFLSSIEKTGAMRQSLVKNARTLKPPENAQSASPRVIAEEEVLAEEMFEKARKAYEKKKRQGQLTFVEQVEFLKMQKKEDERMKKLDLQLERQRREMSAKAREQGQKRKALGYDNTLFSDLVEKVNEPEKRHRRE